MIKIKDESGKVVFEAKDEDTELSQVTHHVFCSAADDAPIGSPGCVCKKLNELKNEKKD